MARPIRVYLSGPITKGNRTDNFAAFCQWQKMLLEEGFAVLNPGLSMLHPDAWNLSHETWVRSDLPWVEVSDCVVRLPGESEGAVQECEHAKALGIPVFPADEEPRLSMDGMGCFLEWVKRQGLREKAKESGKMPEAKESPVKEDKKTAGGTEAPRSFSIGDLVRVVGPRDLADSESGPGFTSTMRAMIGRVFEVEESDRDGECYLQGFHFLPHWLEPADARKFQVEHAKEAAKEPEAKPDTYPHADDVCDHWSGAAGASIPAPVKSILDEAKAAVTGDRQASYGPPDQDFARTAGMWSALFADLLRDGVRFEPFHVAQAMILLKMSRQRHQRKRDNWVDAAGYAHCGAVCDEVAKG